MTAVPVFGHTNIAGVTSLENTDSIKDANFLETDTCLSCLQGAIQWFIFSFLIVSSTRQTSFDYAGAIPAFGRLIHP